MSLVVLFRAWAGKKGEGPQPALFGRQNVSKIVFVMISLFLYVLLMEPVGFIPVTFLFFIYLLGIIEKKKWYYTVFVSIVVTVISYLIFETWLQSQLPKGLLQFLRF
jgi:putative tricarboxylic transport membrane protein